MSDWRNDPASEAQKNRMLGDGLKFDENISKGEASDLIGSLLDPEDEQIAILKFFKVKGITNLSQTDARKIIDKLFDDGEKVERWKNRPATKEQKDIYQFFNIPITSKLSFSEAQKFIDRLFEDEEKYERWENRQDEIEELESWFEDYHELINDDRDMFGSKKIGKKLFRKIVEELESEGFEKSDIENNSELVFNKAFEIDPNIKKVSVNSRSPQNYTTTNSASNKGCSIILFFLILIPLITNLL